MDIGIHNVEKITTRARVHAEFTAVDLEITDDNGQRATLTLYARHERDLDAPSIIAKLRGAVLGMQID